MIQQRTRVVHVSAAAAGVDAPTTQLTALTHLDIDSRSSSDSSSLRVIQRRSGVSRSSRRRRRRHGGGGGGETARVQRRQQQIVCRHDGDVRLVLGRHVVVVAGRQTELVAVALVHPLPQLRRVHLLQANKHVTSVQTRDVSTYN